MTVEYAYIKNRRADRAALIDRMRALLDRADKEHRSLDAEERQSVDRIEAEIGDLDVQIRDLEDRRAREAEADQARAPFERFVRSDTSANHTSDDSLRQLLRGEIREMDVPGVARTVRQDGSVEVRDLLVGTTTTGGYTVPTSFVRQLREHLIETSSIFRLNTTVLTTASGENLDVPKTSAYGTAAIVGEGTALAESDPVFGKITLGAWKYAQLLQASNELIADSGVDIEGFISRQAALALSNGYGNHFMYGTGTNQPQGVIVGASIGSTAQTASTGVPSFDNLWDLMYSVPQPYRTTRAQWRFADSSVGKLRKIKDTTGQYIWQPAVTVGAADTLMGYAVVTDPNVTAFATAAGTAGAFGDFSCYYVRDAGVRFEVSRDYAFANDLTTYRVIQRLDGKMVDTNGVRTLKDPTT